MSILKRLFRRREQPKPSEKKVTIEDQLVTFIGLGRAGKTTILHRLRTGEYFGNAARTMGLNVDFFQYKPIMLGIINRDRNIVYARIKDGWLLRKGSNLRQPS